MVNKYSVLAVRTLEQYLSGSAFGDPTNEIKQELVNLEKPLDILKDLVDGQYEIRRFEYENPDDKENKTWNDETGEYEPTEEGPQRFRAEKIGDNLYFTNSHSVTKGGVEAPVHVFEFTDKQVLLYRLYPNKTKTIRKQFEKEPLRFILDEMGKMRLVERSTVVTFEILVEKRQIFEQYTDDATNYSRGNTETDTTFISETELHMMMQTLYEFATDNVRMTPQSMRCFPFRREKKRNISLDDNVNFQVDNGLSPNQNTTAHSRTAKDGVTPGNTGTSAAMVLEKFSSDNGAGPSRAPTLTLQQHLKDLKEHIENLILDGLDQSQMELLSDLLYDKTEYRLNDISRINDKEILIEILHITEAKVKEYQEKNKQF